MKYKKKPTLTDATQWFRNGDHPADGSTPITSPGSSGQGRLTEGKVVKFFRSLNIPGGRFCAECGNVMQHHGLLQRPHNEEEIICPGDYIVTHSTNGSYYRAKAVDFEAQFEPYEPTPTPMPDQDTELDEVDTRLIG